MKLLPANILLDLDGTLLDSLPGLAFSIGAAFAGEGIAVDLEPLPSLIGPPVRVILSRLRPGLDAAALERLEARFRQSYDTVGWRKTVCFPHAAEALQAVRRTPRRLFVVSNKPRHVALKILEAEDLLPLFEEVVTRDSRAPAYANKAEMIVALCVRRGLSVGDVLMVGDTMEDAEAARQAGTRSMLMTHGYGDVDGKGFPQVDLWCSSFADWLPMLAEERVA